MYERAHSQLSDATFSSFVYIVEEKKIRGKGGTFFDFIYLFFFFFDTSFWKFKNLKL